MSITRAWQSRRGQVAVVIIALIAAGVGFGGSSSSNAQATDSPAGSALSDTKPLSSQVALDQTLAFLNSNVEPKKTYRLAYLAECYANNPYCIAKFNGVQAAAKKFGATVKLYDANFSATNQNKQVQDAVNEGFDGYIFGPAAQVPGCAMWNKYLKPTGKPVGLEDIPICNNPDWTPGSVGFVGFQTQANFDAEHDHDLKEACGTDPCQALSVSGFLGSDLYNMWSKATENAVAKNPNVELVTKTIPAEFSAPKAYGLVLDMLRRNPGVKVILSHDDNMSTGIVRAIRAAGKEPNTDIKVYSQGGPQIGLDMISRGEATGTVNLLPYEEGEYSAAQVLRYLIEGKTTPGWVNLADAKKIKDGPGTVYITKANVDKAQPEY